jgi:hypothetical protein
MSAKRHISTVLGLSQSLDFKFVTISQEKQIASIWNVYALTFSVS